MDRPQLTAAVLLCPQLTVAGGQQPLRHISYHDGHEEDHGSQEGVADAHGHYEKCGTKEDGQACDDVHKMFNFVAMGVFSFSTPEASDAMRPMMVGRPCSPPDPGRCLQGGQEGNSASGERHWQGWGAAVRLHSSSGEPEEGRSWKAQGNRGS